MPPRSKDNIISECKDSGDATLLLYSRGAEEALLEKARALATPSQIEVLQVFMRAQK